MAGLAQGRRRGCEEKRDGAESGWPCRYPRHSWCSCFFVQEGNEMAKSEVYRRSGVQWNGQHAQL
jgi:hypothetical protein